MPATAEQRSIFEHLARRSDDRVLAGVAGGVADALGVSAGYVRAGFVVLTALWGLGAIFYVALWIASFDRVEDRKAKLLAPSRQAGLGLIFAGGVLVFRAVGWWPGDALMVMITTLAVGVAVLGDTDWMGRVFDPQGARPSRLRVVAGVVLLLVGLGVLLASVSRIRTLGAVATAVIITILGVVLVFGPWLVSLGRQLVTERRERIRQEERAEMAAHLHDSVLQTLALMQRTDDPKRVMTLARQQERELRSWLYDGGSSQAEDRLSTALQQAAARIEGDFTIPIEVVTVGDATVDETSRALVSAATEAMVNGAKHSGAGEISVYAEVADGKADVWVADLGTGFDPVNVADDRRGLRDSIEARLGRAGGGATVESTIGEGTEVHMWAPVHMITTESDEVAR
ncbi:MAG: PspC domain-containing protein [Acidimicrobiia bacterium]